jgi:hypothetical protein
MRTIKKFIALFLVFISVNNSFAQQTITGSVIDNETNEPLIGATVVLTDTAEGTMTDLSGRFNFITTNTIDSISVSYTGYTSKTIKYSNGENIKLNVSASLLDQVIISASREEQNRKDAPVAISVISTKEIN